MVDLVGRQDHTLAGETTTWLERTDARVGIPRDGTVRPGVRGQYAGEVCLRSKQESPRREGFAWAPRVADAQQRKTRARAWISRRVDLAVA